MIVQVPHKLHSTTKRSIMAEIVIGKKALGPSPLHALEKVSVRSRRHPESRERLFQSPILATNLHAHEAFTGIRKARSVFSSGDKIFENGLHPLTQIQKCGVEIEDHQNFAGLGRLGGAGEFE
jgi:hypothetical protein